MAAAGQIRLAVVKSRRDGDSFDVTVDIRPVMTWAAAVGPLTARRISLRPGPRCFRLLLIAV